MADEDRFGVVPGSGPPPANPDPYAAPAAPPPYGMAPAYGGAPGSQPPPPFGAPPPPPFGPPPAFGQPGWGQPGYGGYGYPAAPVGNDGVAVAALVCGLACLLCVPAVVTAPAAVVLGIVALRRISRSRAEGRGMAIAGIVLGALFVAAGIVLVAAGVLSGISRTTTGSPPGSSYSGAYRLTVGQCVPSMSAGTAFRAVDCATPHAGQVYATAPLTGSVYAGESLTKVEAREACRAAFVSGGYDSALYTYFWVYPTQAAWDQGEHRVTCFVADAGGSLLTGSVLVSGGAASAGANA